MELRQDKGQHAVYSLQFYLVLVTKHRREIITGKVAGRLKELVSGVASSFGVGIIRQITEKDNFQLLFSGRPMLIIPRFVNSLKTVTSRKIRKEFPHIREGFWERSYFIASVGEVSKEDVRRYVESFARG